MFKIRPKGGEGGRHQSTGEAVVCPSGTVVFVRLYSNFLNNKSPRSQS